MARFEVKKGKVYDACNGEAMSAEHVAAYMNLADDGHGETFRQLAEKETECERLREALALVVSEFSHVTGPGTFDGKDAESLAEIVETARALLSKGASDGD